MKIILKYVITNVRESKIRTAVMLLSIVLSTMLLFVSFSIGVSYENAQQKMARGMAGSATISVQAKNRNIMADDIPNIPAAAVKAGILKGSAVYHENGYYETVDLLAPDLATFCQMNKPRLKNGGEISNFSGNQIILPDRFTSKYGIEKGDHITLEINRTPTVFEVAEIAAYDTVFLRHTRGVTALLPQTALSQLLGQPEGYSEILIQPASGAVTQDLITQLENALPHSDYAISEIVNDAQIAADARQKSMPFFLISFFSLTMSIFIIYSSYKVITLDRLPVIGTFRTIGATEKNVTYILLLESMLYGCAGTLLGIPAGVLVLKSILQGMGQSLAQGIEITAIISLPTIFFSVFTVVLATVLSAYLPIRRASKLPIKEVVLGATEEKCVPHTIILGIGVVLFIVSFILPDIASDKMLYLAGGFSLLGFIAGTVLIIPLLTNFTAALLERLYGVIFKNEGRLAARNMRDNKNITQNVTLLFISISAVIIITIVGNFVTTYVSDVFHGAELQGFADGPMEPEFIEKVRAMDGIGEILPLYVFHETATGNGVPVSRLEATEQLESYNSMLALHYTDPSMQEKAEASFAAGNRTVILSESCIERIGCSVGDAIVLSYEAREAPYVIAGSFKSRATDVEAVIPAACAISDFNVKTYGFLAYTAADPEAVMVQIRDLFGNTSNWSRTVEEFNTDALATVGAFLSPMHSMTSFILLLTPVGIINNLLINYIQKRRTLAMYKSIGLSNRQNMKITLLEGFSTGLLGTIIAIFVSYLEIRTVFTVAAPKLSMLPVLDIWTFVRAGAFGILITLFGSMVPIFKTRRMKLIEEIKFE